MNQSTPTFTGKSRFILIAVMLSGAFVAILNQTVLSPALPKIMADLNITASEGQWLTTAFMLVNGIMIPITAYLINKFTTRQLFISAMGIFSLGTVIAAISPTFSLLLLARIFQAMGAGILMPLQQTVLLYIFPREKRGAAMGMIGLVMVFAPAIGPTLAGWLVDAFSWHAIFYVIAPFAILDIILAVLLLKNVGMTSDPSLDMLSVVYSTLGFGGLLYGFSVAGTAGWTSVSTLSTLIIGTVSLILFVRRQLSLEQPLLELRVFSNKIFTYSTILGMIVNAALIAGGIIMPIYIQSIRGFAAIDSGLMMLPGAIIMGIMSPITGRMFDKFGPRTLSLVGLAVMTAATGCLANLTETTALSYLTVVYTIRMFGMSMLMMPLTTWGLNALDNSLLAHGTAASNTMRQVAGSIGTALLITVMTVTTKGSAPLGPALSTIHGMNMAFACATALSLMALILAIVVVKEPKNKQHN